MAHSVPDTVAVVLETAGGRIVHTGDYKLDHTPVDGLRTDVGKLAELGNRGIDLLLGDSTNAERPGVTRLGAARRRGVPAHHPGREGRILIACFASNVHRMQQAVDVAVEAGRKVAVVGRSMRKNMNIARNLGYLEAPEDASSAPPSSTSTGAARGADPLHRQPGRADVGADRGSRTTTTRRCRRARGHRDPLGEAGPGNELRVHDTINRLAKAGAEVLHQEIANVHVSGHGNSEEIRTIIGLVRPKAVMPVHGEFRMLAAHAQARPRRRRAGGLDRARRERLGRRARQGPAAAHRRARSNAGMTFVDGLGVGDVKDVALRDRRHLRRTAC